MQWKSNDIEVATVYAFDEGATRSLDQFLF